MRFYTLPHRSVALYSLSEVLMHVLPTSVTVKAVTSSSRTTPSCDYYTIIANATRTQFLALQIQHQVSVQSAAKRDSARSTWLGLCCFKSNINLDPARDGLLYSIMNECANIQMRRSECFCHTYQTKSTHEAGVYYTYLYTFIYSILLQFTYIFTRLSLMPVVMLDALQWTAYNSGPQVTLDYYSVWIHQLNNRTTVCD